MRKAAAMNCGNPVAEMACDVLNAAEQFDFFAGLVTEIKGDTMPMADRPGQPVVVRALRRRWQRRGLQPPAEVHRCKKRCAAGCRQLGRDEAALPGADVVLPPDRTHRPRLPVRRAQHRD